MHGGNDQVAVPALQVGQRVVNFVIILAAVIQQGKETDFDPADFLHPIGAVAEVQDAGAVQGRQGILIPCFAEVVGVVVAQADCFHTALRQYVLIGFRSRKIKGLLHFYRMGG